MPPAAPVTTTTRPSRALTDVGRGSRIALIAAPAVRSEPPSSAAGRLFYKRTIKSKGSERELLARRGHHPNVAPLRRVATLVAAVLCLAGCTWPGPVDRSAPAVERTLDVEAGTIDGVGVGSTDAQVRATLGPPTAPDTGAAFPADEGPGFEGPNAIPMPELGRDGPRILRYPGVAFLVADDVVFAVVGGRGVTTENGVHVGDDLALARAAYGKLGCRERPGPEPIVPGDERDTYPECQRRIGDLRLIVTGDPIASISVAALRP